MCGRYAFYSPHEAMVDVFGLDDPPQVEPRYNIAPTQFVPAVRLADDKPELVMLRWGLIPFWAKDVSIGNRMINARGETVREKPAFKYAFAKRRCLLPATGFYEWKPGADGKTPHFIHAPGHRPFAFAGLWERWRPKDDPDAAPLETCTIITTSPNGFMSALHDRMPVIIPERDHAGWLAPDAAPGDLLELLAPFAGDLAAHAVSREVNNPRNESATLVEPAA